MWIGPVWVVAVLLVIFQCSCAYADPKGGRGGGGRTGGRSSGSRSSGSRSSGGSWSRTSGGSSHTAGRAGGTGAVPTWLIVLLSILMLVIICACLYYYICVNKKKTPVADDEDGQKGRYQPAPPDNPAVEQV